MRVDYALTPPGASLATLFSAVKEWAEEHIEEVVEARERYDTEAGAGATARATDGATDGAAAGAQWP